jgi:hypothetical protein
MSAYGPKRTQAVLPGRFCGSPHRVAAYATSTGATGHAGIATSSQLTFHLDHSMKAAQVELLNAICP